MEKKKLVVKRRIRPLVRVEDFLKRFEGQCSRSMLQMLRFRWKLFPPTIIIGRVGIQAGIDGYLCEETIEYLEKILQLRKQGKEYSVIARELKYERDKIFEITARAKEREFYFSDNSLEAINQSIEGLEDLAQRCGQTIFKGNLVNDYLEAMEKYDNEESTTKKNNLEKLLIIYARFLRASVNTYTDLANPADL